MKGRDVKTKRARKSWEEVAALQNYEDPANRILMGPHTAFQYRTDAKHLCFILSRYKFCSKLLAERRAVLEVGCGDAFGTPIVAQAVESLTAVDWDSLLIASACERLAFVENCTFRRHDIIEGPINGAFDGIYSVDVIEHIEPSMEGIFMTNCCAALTIDGMFIAGTPNVKAEAYASPSSKTGHINLKDAVGLKQLFSKYFRTVLLFSMNDEIVHTGFYNMAHYLFAVGVGLRE